MKKYLIIVLLLSGLSSVWSQSFTVFVDDADFTKAALSYLEGEKTYYIDSIFAQKSGEFSFQMENKHSGFYRLAFSNNKWIDFIYDKEDVILQINGEAILDSMKVIKSESNRLYYEFVRLNKDYKTKTELLQFVLARYPNEDDFYTSTLNKLHQLQSEYLEFVNITSQKEPDKFVSRYIQSSQLPLMDGDLSFEEKLAFLKSHSLDYVDFNDTGLIYSDAFTNKTIEYLTYYRNPQLPKELLEKEFMTAVDTLMSKAKVNPLVYQHIADYLIDGFKKFGFDIVIDYIVENYVIADDLCLDEETENSIQRRIDQAKFLPVGAAAPNIVLPDSSGKLIDMSTIEADKLLILFYSSWCTHCAEMLPKLNELYQNQKDNKFEVLAISMDTERNDWLNFIRDNKLSWVNVSDLHGWDSKAASEYYIYATPTMFLIDRNKNITEKPVTLNELKNLNIFK